MSKQRIRLHPNASSFKFDTNKRVSIIEQPDGSFKLEVSYACENPQTPAVAHKCVKGKVRASCMHMSEAALDAIMIAYIEYKKSKFEQLTRERK